MDRNVELAIKITSDATDAATDFDRAGAAALQMGDDIDQASRQARTAADRIDAAADASDTLASKTSQATGGLGALASGFELVGAEKYAGALQGAALATDFFSGVGDIANLVLNSQILITAKAKAAALASAAATGVQTAATTAMTAAQAAFNAVMALNPIALVVIAVVALVAALVVAYKKSETFRRIVDAAFRAVQAAAAFAFNWIKDNWRLILTIITGPIGLAVALVTKYWDRIKAGAQTVLDRVREIFGNIKGAIERALDGIGNVIGNAFDLALAPIQAIADAIGNVIDLIQSIPTPDLSFLPGLRTTATTTGATGGRSNETTVINLNGVLDTGSGVDQLVKVLNARARRVGGQVILV